MDAASPRLFGARVKRVEDPRLLRGEGCYLADLRRPGTLQAAFLRSPHAHARIVRLDLSATQALPGVHLVLDGEQAAPLARPFRVPMEAEHYRPTNQPHLAQGKVRHVGEIVAMVVADDAYLARDALDLIEVEYEPLPVVADLQQALAPGASAVHDEAPDNLLFVRNHRVGRVDQAFAEAEVVVEAAFHSPRYAGLSMENRGVLAEVEAESGRLRMWSSTQVPFTVRDAVATALGLDEIQVSVAVPDVGGGFGIKAMVYPEEVLVPLAARLLGRPVMWAGDRQEDLQSSVQARSQIIRAGLAARIDGRITGLRAEVFCDVGAYGSYPYGPALEATGTPGMLPGPYDIRDYAYVTRAVATNKVPEGAYRGVGMVVATFVHERLIDLLAARLDLDPAEVRRRNFIPPGALPYQTSSGMLYDSGSYSESLELLLAAADYPALRKRQAEARRQGRLLGIGLSSYVEFTGLGTAVYRGRGMALVDGREAARLVAEPDGRVRVLASLPSQGQGLATTLAQVVADDLGLPLERVVVEPPHTDQTPFGTGTFASRSSILGTSAALLASADLKAEACRQSAALLEVSPADCVFERGGVTVRGVPDRRVELAELAARVVDSSGPALSASREYDPAGTTFANASHLCLVEVDPETGLVEVLRYVVAEDCGKVVNPTIVDGQIQGAVAQGIGGALFEEVVYDEQGQLLTGSLLDYLAPGCAEMPNLEIHHLETPAPHSLAGTKGVGEGGTIGAAPAVANAVADALGVAVTGLPLSPSRVLELVRSRPVKAGPSTLDTGSSPIIPGP